MTGSLRTLINAKMNTAESADTLEATLTYQPQALKFGTSGRRGEVIHLTQLEVYLNALAELEYLQSLPLDEGGITQGEEFFFAYDLRPSSSSYVAEQQHRGELAQAIVQAIRDAGMKPVNLGQIPTPALALHGFTHAKGSIMVTGSHIPFDRNGYKTNTSNGELLKQHEWPINENVKKVRQRLYAQPFAESLFDEEGRFKAGHSDLPAVNGAAADAYISRYLDFFGGEVLAGFRLVVYQHSAVGRDILVEILRRLGADVFPIGRSDTFVPIDTENMDEPLLASIQQLHDASAVQCVSIDAVLSTDGDSDRPMILGVNAGQVQFFGGDLVGMITAELLGADAVVVPISCNDAIDLGALKDVTAPKTKIGSPFVIAGMKTAIAHGKQAVCGFEANGGFLTATHLTRNGNTLTPLPTRDAILPILAVLLAAKEKGESVCQLFERLPKRYSKAALLKSFPAERGRKIVSHYSSSDARVAELRVNPSGIESFDKQGFHLSAPESGIPSAKPILQELSTYFPPAMGFGKIVRINYLDGLRIVFNNGDIIHIRPSGNADELRVYAVADTRERAGEMIQLAVAEPEGIVRRMEKRIG